MTAKIGRAARLESKPSSLSSSYEVEQITAYFPGPWREARTTSASCFLNLEQWPCRTDPSDICNCLRLSSKHLANQHCYVAFDGKEIISKEGFHSLLWSALELLDYCFLEGRRRENRSGTSGTGSASCPFGSPQHVAKFTPPCLCSIV